MRKTWVLRYRDPVTRKQRKEMLGEYPALGLAEARDRVRHLRQLIADGISPAERRRQQQEDAASALTCGDLFHRWFSYEESTGRVTETWRKQWRARWERHLAIPLGHVPIEGLKRAHLAPVFEAMRQQGIRQETRHALSQVSTMLNYAVSRGLLAENPARLLRPRDFDVSQSPPRERFLELWEIRRLLEAIRKAQQKTRVSRSAQLSPQVANCLRFLLLTGIRRSVAAEMSWSEVDFHRSLWLIPASRMKNRREHRVHLSGSALKILNWMKQLPGTEHFVFASPAKPGYPISATSVTRAVTRLREAYLPELAPFTAHDLRRTASTGWGECCGAAPHIIERMLAHLPQDKLILTYQRQTEFPEMARVWDAWGELLREDLSDFG
jgi:integrase